MYRAIAQGRTVSDAALSDLDNTRLLNMTSSISIKQLRAARLALSEDRIADAIRILEELIRIGDTEAMYIRSQIGIEDEAEEVYWARSLALLREAASKQHAGAMYQLSVLLEVGENVAKDEKQAKELLAQAAQAGHPHALWRIGLIRLYGDENTVPDPVSGKRLIEEAAAKRSQGALRTLANFYEKGLFGYPQDLETAKKLYDDAEADDALPL